MAVLDSQTHKDPDKEVRAPRARMTGSERRQQLIGIARSLFAERGYEGTSIEEIALRANVSKPVVYEHFGGKEGLYAVVVDREMSALLDGITSSLTNNRSRVRVERVALALLTYVEERTDGFRIMIRDSPAAISSGTYSSLLNDAVSQVSSILAGDFARRGLDPDLAPLYAQALVGSVSMTAQWWLDTREPKKEVVAAHLVNLMWNGLTHLEADPGCKTSERSAGVTPRRSPAGFGRRGVTSGEPGLPAVAGQQVGHGFAADQFPGPALADRHQRRAPDHVVVRRHAVVVGAGTGHGQQVTRAQIGGQPDVAGDLVAGLAVPARHRDPLLEAQRMPVGQRDGIPRAVQRHPRVVAHAAVDGDEGPPAALRLHRAHPVQGHPGPTADGPARLHHDLRAGNRSAAHASSRASSITSASWSRFSSGSPDAYGMACPHRYSARSG